MTRVVFIRHGQTEWNINGRYQGQSDVPLSPVGIKQAEKLAADFPVADIKAVYASDLERAMVTAKKVAAKFNLEVQSEPAFRELNFGDWEGLTYKEIVSKWPDAMKNFLNHPDILKVPHGETFLQVQERSNQRLQELIAKHNDETIVITAHGAVLRTILATAMHIPLQYLWSIRQFNTAVSIVTYNTDGSNSIELLNSTAHLRELR